MELVALSRVTVEGALAVIMAVVLFCGSVYLLLSAVLGRWMGYLVAATGFFAFMMILSAIWAFGAPGTPRHLGPKGKLPHWVAVGEGVTVRSPSHRVVGTYPGDPWRPAGKDEELAPEVEPATVAFQELLAGEANRELRRAGVEGDVLPADFQVRDVRFADADGRLLAAARAFAGTGGPEVTVVGFKHNGDEATPSFAFLFGSLIGFGAHLPLLDRAERRRKEILTGGEQQPWRGPA